jgi:hypothetical protein
MRRNQVPFPELKELGVSSSAFFSGSLNNHLVITQLLIHALESRYKFLEKKNVLSSVVCLWLLLAPSTAICKRKIAKSCATPQGITHE